MFDQIAIETPPHAARSGSRPAFSWRTRPWKRGWRASPIRTEIAAFQCARPLRVASMVPWPPLDAAAVEAALRVACHRAQELRRIGVRRARTADCCAPSNSRCRRGRAACWTRSRRRPIRLPRGRQVPVHYEPDQPPWIASRLQDFFGMRETPTVARGAVPVVVRLLAPNQRPVQMTTDLAGFWQRLYPQVRKELSRRYPKHAWPENPLV